MSFNKLSLSGGSNKGYCYIGVMRTLEEFNTMKDIDTIAGTSIGSFFATLIAMGFSYTDLLNFINEEVEFKDISLENFINTYGFTEGSEIINLMIKIIEQKYYKEITFKELFKVSKKKLIIIATCLDDVKQVYFSHETEPDMKIIEAIRLSISIPFIFSAKKYKGKTYIDGGLMENTPQHIFKKTDKVLTFVLKNDNKDTNKPEDNLENYILQVFSCVKEKLINKIENPYMNICYIKIDSINPINFNLNKETKLKLYNIGYKISRNYLKKLI